MFFMFGLMLAPPIVLTFLGVLNLLDLKSSEKEHGSIRSLMYVYNELLARRKEKEKEKEKETTTLENMPTHVVSPYKTAPMVRFVPFFNPKFTWKKHY